MFKEFLEMKNISLSNILALLFLLQTFSVTGIVGYLSFRNNQEAVDALAKQLSREISISIEKELKDYFQTPYRINRVNATAFTTSALAFEESIAGEELLYQQMKATPNLSFIYCGSAQTGEFIGVLRSPEDNSIQLSYSNQSTNYFRQYYDLDIRGKRTHFLYQSEQTFDARQRPWYQNAIRSERLVWTNIYTAFTTGLPNITASFPVYGYFDEIIGVCATDVVLPKEFRAFLRDLRIGKTGQAFVLDRDGRMISNSTDESLITENEKTAYPLLAINTKDPLVQKTTSYLSKYFGGFEKIRQTEQLEFYIDGEKQLLQVLPFQYKTGLDWLIIVVIPKTDFTAQITANTKTTLLLCLVLLLMIVPVEIYTSRYIAQPILQLSKVSKVIAQGQLKQRVKISGTRELSILAGSFNNMVQQLRESFAALKNSNLELESTLIQLELSQSELAQANQQLEDYAHTLEDKVEKRTIELKAAQKCIVAQEKMAALGILTAGIAHELRNPLNFVQNYAEGSIELGQDLIEELEPILEPLEEETSGCIKALLADLQENATTIQHNSQRANQIIHGMMQHSHANAEQATPEPTLLNDLLNRAASLPLTKSKPKTKIST